MKILGAACVAFALGTLVFHLSSPVGNCDSTTDPTDKELTTKTPRVTIILRSRKKEETNRTGIASLSDKAISEYLKHVAGGRPFKLSEFRDLPLTVAYGPEGKPVTEPLRLYYSVDVIVHGDFLQFDSKRDNEERESD